MTTDTPPSGGGKFSVDLTGVKGFIATVVLVLVTLTSILQAVNATLPGKIETPSTTQALGVSNFDVIEANGVKATTVTTTKLISQTVGVDADSATIKYITATTTSAGGLTANTFVLGGVTYTATDPITITGVVSNVRLLYKQVP